MNFRLVHCRRQCCHREPKPPPMATACNGFAGRPMGHPWFAPKATSLHSLSWQTSPIVSVRESISSRETNMSASREHSSSALPKVFQSACGAHSRTRFPTATYVATWLTRYLLHCTLLCQHLHYKFLFRQHVGPFTHGQRKTCDMFVCGQERRGTINDQNLKRRSGRSPSKRKENNK